MWFSVTATAAGFRFVDEHGLDVCRSYEPRGKELLCLEVEGEQRIHFAKWPGPRSPGFTVVISRGLGPAMIEGRESVSQSPDAQTVSVRGRTGPRNLLDLP